MSQLIISGAASGAAAADATAAILNTVESIAAPCVNGSSLKNDNYNVGGGIGGGGNYNVGYDGNDDGNFGETGGNYAGFNENEQNSYNENDQSNYNENDPDNFNGNDVNYNDNEGNDFDQNDADDLNETDDFNNRTNETNPTDTDASELKATEAGLKSEAASSGTSISSGRVSRDHYYWYKVISTWENTHRHTFKSVASYLRSNHTPPDMIGTLSDQQSFRRYLRKYHKNELHPTPNRKRNRKGVYMEVERKLSDYIKTRAKLLEHDPNDRHGLTWVELADRAKMYAEMEHDEIYKTFEASPGWISRVLKRANIGSTVTLSGDVGDMQQHIKDELLLDVEGKSGEDNGEGESDVKNSSGGSGKDGHNNSGSRRDERNDGPVIDETTAYFYLKEVKRYANSIKVPKDDILLIDIVSRRLVAAAPTSRPAKRKKSPSKNVKDENAGVGDHNGVL